MIYPLAFLFQDASQEIPAGAGAAGTAFGLAFMLVWLAIALVVIAGMWKVFVKAGKPGWAAIVPIYNMIVLLEIAGKPLWWFILLLVPVVNFIIIIMMSISIAARFGKGTGFALGLAFLAPIFYPVLGFGDARYNPQAG